METTAQVMTSVREYVLSSVNLEDVDDDENLFEAGLVNSLFAIQLVAFLEKTFSIDVEADDLDMKNFESIAAVAAFVTSKRSSGSG